MSILSDPRTWNDGDKTTPLSAARLNAMEADFATLDNGLSAETARADLAYRPTAPPGYLAANYDPIYINGTGTAPVSGTRYLARLTLPVDSTVTSLCLYANAGDSGLTTGQNFAALYDTSGNRLGITADQKTNWATSGPKTMDVAAGPLDLDAGDYIAVLLANGVSSLLFGRVQTLAGNLYNGSLTGAAMRWATNGTGATSLPSTLTLSSNTVSALTFWVGLS